MKPDRTLVPTGQFTGVVSVPVFAAMFTLYAFVTMTTYDLLADPGLVKRARAEFESMK